MEENHLVIEIAGVGFMVNVPVALLAEAKVGNSISLQTYLVVRETELSLFGFRGVEERNLFVLLLGVNGVGPRLALAILSSLNVETVHSAVNASQVDVLSSVPGVGKKTAQKIVLHLADRLAPISGDQKAEAVDPIHADLLEALTGLGYSVVEAQAAMQSIPEDSSQNLEERLKFALNYFNSPN